MARREIRFGVVGCGLMGREFASAAARWCHLVDVDFAPKIVAACDTNPAMLHWFTSNFSTVSLATDDYRRLLDNADIDVIYCAIPHHLHADFYGNIVEAGKHLMGEKPFGIDREANTKILSTIKAHPDVFVRCSSEFPFFPGTYRILQYIREERFGRILEVESGFWHSSDMDPHKRINWKRMAAYCGEYGCLGDLGLHVLHIPLRVGWEPKNVRAFLSKFVTERPDRDGNMVACDTWDNGILACEVETEGQHFPMFLSTKRIAPSETNTWFIRVMGTELSAEYNTKFPKTLRTLPYHPGEEQAWRVLDLGYASPYPTITGSIFEFGFSDGLLQMWAAFCDDLVHGRDQMMQPVYCATPDETARHHTIMTAALDSNRRASTVAPGRSAG